MTYDEIKKIAMRHGVKIAGKKADIVRAIQRKEGNTPCFATGKLSECGQLRCLWQEVCE